MGYGYSGSTATGTGSGNTSVSVVRPWIVQRPYSQVRSDGSPGARSAQRRPASRQARANSEKLYGPMEYNSQTYLPPIVVRLTRQEELHEGASPAWVILPLAGSSRCPW